MQRKLIIFDFDDTLCLWLLGPIAREKYETRLRAYLQREADSGTVLVVVSYNPDAEMRLVQMRIREHFSRVIHEPQRPKADTVKDLITAGEYTNITYYDDDIDSVLGVRALGVTAINVAKRIGVPIPSGGC